MDHNKLWEIIKDMGISYLYDMSIWHASWEIYMQVRKQQLKLDMKQPIGSKLEKENIKAVYCHPAYLT